MVIKISFSKRVIVAHSVICFTLKAAMLPYTTAAEAMLITIVITTTTKQLGNMRFACLSYLCASDTTDHMTAANRARREREVSSKVWLIREAAPDSLMAAHDGGVLIEGHWRLQQEAGLVSVHTLGSPYGQHSSGVHPTELNTEPLRELTETL